MAKKIFVPPRKNIRIKTGGKARLSSSHRKPPPKSNGQVRQDPSPEEGQQEAVSQLDPVYVNPDGSIRYFAMVQATPTPDPDADDQETDN